MEFYYSTRYTSRKSIINEYYCVYYWIIHERNFCYNWPRDVVYVVIELFTHFLFCCQPPYLLGGQGQARESTWNTDFLKKYRISLMKADKLVLSNVPRWFSGWSWNVTSSIVHQMMVRGNKFQCTLLVLILLTLLYNK